MTRYRVTVPERWDQDYYVKAETPEEAKDKVLNGQGLAIDNALKFVELIQDDMSFWHVEEEE